MEDILYLRIKFTEYVQTYMRKYVKFIERQ